MLDIDLIRNDPQGVEEALKHRDSSISLRPILAVDKQRRKLAFQAETLRATRNRTSQELSKLKDKPTELLEKMREVGREIKGLEDKLKDKDNKLRDLLLRLPNLPKNTTPLGLDSLSNRVLRTWGIVKQFDFKPLPHWNLAETLDIIDFQRGAKLSGSRFFLLKGRGAQLQRALTNWMLDLHIQQHGYTEIAPPYLVKRETMIGSGNLPKFGDNLYHDEEDDLWLIPTAEVPLTGLHREEILEPTKLPLYYVAYTPCFRREKAAAGRDTRGLKRVHQFDKVELYKIVEPEKSDAELDGLLANAAEIGWKLNIPYRVVELCTGDMGFPSAKSYDLEMYAPGCEEWLEVSSCSNCTDFQARRSGIRFRRHPGARPEFPHTLNGSALALPRLMIAILETYQQRDGSIVIPEVLRPYTGFAKIEPLQKKSYGDN